ncbi:MAG: CinA family protein [Bdellovibrio sp.]|nr:MAG: CinA family protein [Bdellovibrio sp.]
MTVEELKQQIHNRFVEREQTLSLAESCTGGLLSSWVTSLSGASQFYKGGVVSYTAFAKQKLLKVPMETIKAYGEVSLPVARAMARGAKEVLKSHWSVSITGIAGPGGGTPEKPVGTVCFGLCGPGIEKVSLQHFEGDRLFIQKQAAQWALSFLLEGIQS